MAIFSRDLSGAPALVMEKPAINDTYVVGEWAADGLTDGTDHGTVITGETAMKGFVGIFNAAATTAGVMASENLDTMPVVCNPFGTYLAEYSQATDLDVASYSVPNMVFTCSDGIGHPNLGGGWIYRTLAPGAGELDFILSSSVSTTSCTVALANVPTVDPTSSSDFIIIYPLGQYAAYLGVTNLKANIDSGYQTAGGTYGIAANVIENYITTDGRSYEPLRFGGKNMAQDVDANTRKLDKNHVGLTGLNSANVKFYAEICLFRGSQFGADIGL